MTQGIVPPEIAREISRLNRRVHDLERMLGDPATLLRDHGLPFTLAGTLYVTESAPWPPSFTVRISEVEALLGTAGSSATTIEVRKNGSSIGGGFTLPASEKRRKWTVSVPITNDDIITVAITAAGTGAADLDVIVRFR